MTHGMITGVNAVEPRTSQDTEGEVQRVLSKLEASGNDIKIMRLMANSPNAFRPFLLMSISLMERAQLRAVDREVAILRLAALLDVEYEWREHVAISAKLGITDEQRDAIRAGRTDDATLFDESERLAMRVAETIHRERRMPTALWDESCAAWGKEGALEAVLVTAWWGGFVPTVINCLGITDPG